MSKAASLGRRCLRVSLCVGGFSDTDSRRSTQLAAAASVLPSTHTCTETDTHLSSHALPLLSSCNLRMRSEECIEAIKYSVAQTQAHSSDKKKLLLFPLSLRLCSCLRLCFCLLLSPSLFFDSGSCCRRRGCRRQAAVCVKRALNARIRETDRPSGERG